ncbi:hypothetical protein C8Q74DRAFT_1270041 [Fomes fomentarius]|nr:hypothetical protein C8Q74DRAFT_1270041 [Fomes fomentarius]
MHAQPEYNKQPPPSDHSDCDSRMYAVHRQSETTPMLWKPESSPPPRYRASPVGCILLTTLSGLLFALLILQNLGWVASFADDVPADEKWAMRRQWKEETKAHEFLVRQWDHNRASYEEEVRGWEHKRAEWREEEKKWEEMRRDEERRHKEVERLGPNWTVPIGDSGCMEYGTRIYRAQLKDLNICANMPITVHGRVIDKPDQCKRDQHGQVWGAWYVNYDEPSCTPYWGPFIDKGHTPGKKGMTVRCTMYNVQNSLCSILLKCFESQLMGIQHGDSWEKMCATTPTTIHGQTYDIPTNCENRSIFGIYGIWDVPIRSTEGMHN